MSGFTFPPPPPPPPKAAQPDVDQQTSQRGGPSRGRGRGAGGDFEHRGRGRGGSRGRGRGAPGHQPYQGSYSQSGSIASSGPATGSNAHSTGLPPRPGPQDGHRRPTSSAGDQSLRNTAGHKRKLDALRGPPPEKREKKPAPATAPAIPSFGAPFLPAPVFPAAKVPTTSSPSQPKPKPGKGLGLTPGTADPQYSSSESEDEEREVDEEALYAELGDKLTFEHNGVVMSLNSQADLAAWKKDRQKKWPTKARMAERDVERRRVGEERKRLLASVEHLYGRRDLVWKARNDDQNYGGNLNGGTVEASNPAETELEKAKREMAEKTKRLDELRRKVTESEARNRRLREKAEQTAEAANAVEESASHDQAHSTEHADNEEIVSPATDPVSADLTIEGDERKVSPSPSSSSDTSSASDSDEGPPEEITSKAPSVPMDDANARRAICKYFRASGYCRDGDACRFKHVQDVRTQPNSAPADQQRAVQRPEHVRKDERPPRLDPGPERMTIFQRLVEQERAEADKVAVDVVKYLGDMGFFAAA